VVPALGNRVWLPVVDAPRLVALCRAIRNSVLSASRDPKAKGVAGHTPTSTGGGRNTVARFLFASPRKRSALQQRAMLLPLVLSEKPTTRSYRPGSNSCEMRNRSFSLQFTQNASL
jgi:hypothetical protein